MKQYLNIFLLIVIIVFSGCKGIDSIFNPYKAPELDEKGVVLSADSVHPMDTVTASIKAVNPEDGPLYYEWSAAGNGRFIEPADKDTVYWIAPLNGGTYTIKVIVSNEKKHSEAYKDIAVIVVTEPLVDILKPNKDTYFIQYELVEVEAYASHNNEVTTVRLFVNDIKKYEVDHNDTDIYQFEFETDSTMVGTTTIKVEADNTLGKTGADSITINVEEFIPGKNEN